MSGALVKRGKTWNVLLSTEGSNGQLKQKWISTGIKSKKYAEKVLNKIMCQVNKNSYIAPSKQIPRKITASNS